MTTTAKVDLFDPGFNADPHATYRRLREEAPACRVTIPDRGEVWLLTRHADVLAVLRDDTRFSTRAMVSQGAGAPVVSPGARGVMALFDSFMSSNDPPDHTRLRALVQKAFTPRLVEGMRGFVQDLADRLLDAVHERADATGDRSMDLIADYAFPLPVTVIMNLLGIPEQDREDLRRWSRALARFDRSPASAEALTGELVPYLDYVRGLLEARRRAPGDDLLSALVAPDRADSLSETELVSMTFGLTFAGHETTTHLLGNSVLALLEHPGQLARLRTDRDAMRWAVEEFLRYDGPIELRRRIALEDVEVGGVQIRRGEVVLVSLAAADRDPAVFDAPDRLDITREDTHHVAFGRGVHACLGAPLARLEAEIALSTLLRRMPDLRLAVPRDELQWKPSGLHLRGLAALPLRF
ncbi:cytochrome P450 family protein [Nucisporomicrobium flavum]|uniref:cytochrome P450 family protein n=1 Tax=Nucisporomicrobium flavum TaxID=2785915 RepID=UPI0018F29003|nr:cytochrome P450 [Nucisporomicrobium flavum]